MNWHWEVYKLEVYIRFTQFPKYIIVGPIS